MYTHTQAQLSPTRTQSRGTSTVRCTAIRRTACTARSNRVQIYCEQGSLAMLSADGRHWHPRQQGGEQSKCLRLSLSCEASAASLRTYPSFASPLRLSGEPPDSRRGDAVTFNPSRRASCEGAGEPRGSHAASLNEGLGRVHGQKAALPLLCFGVQGMSQGAGARTGEHSFAARVVESGPIPTL